MEVIERGKNT